MYMAEYTRVHYYTGINVNTSDQKIHENDFFGFIQLLIPVYLKIWKTPKRKKQPKEAELYLIKKDDCVHSYLGLWFFYLMLVFFACVCMARKTCKYFSFSRCFLVVFSSSSLVKLVSVFLLRFRFGDLATRVSHISIFVTIVALKPAETADFFWDFWRSSSLPILN